METILTINAGSSSLKFQVFATDGSKELRRLIKAQMDGVGTRPRLCAHGSDRKILIDKSYSPNDVADLPAAIQATASWLRESQRVDFVAVGHRVVHGGPRYQEPVLVDGQVLAQLERYVPLAPLHQPNNLAPIRILLELQPNLPQVACFDTAFHRSHGALADHYAIPERLYDEGVRRYGFHGLSYEYVADHLRQVAPDIAMGRVIIAHLGSGASMCALNRGHSIESTMGFTALDGLPMGTRPGQLDPGVVLYLIAEKGMTAGEVQDLLYRECGLKGLSGISNDVRELQDSPDPRAAFAMDYFVHRVGLHAAMLAGALGGIDAFVFTAGIGENSVTLRARIAGKLAWLGVALDEAANEARETVISSCNSLVPLYVIPTDEEVMIARHTVALLARPGVQQAVTAA